jgi:hypothetical protein
MHSVYANHFGTAWELLAVSWSYLLQGVTLQLTANSK